MKKLILPSLAFLLMASCSNSNTEEKNNVSLAVSTEVVDAFLTSTSSFEETNFKQPIVEFQKQAEARSLKKMTFTKNNFNEVLEEAKNFDNLVIVVGNHTIVKVEDVNNCVESGSWGNCMPYGEGYIKKGELNFQKDYINYIIGKPDNQVRIAYFF